MCVHVLYEDVSTTMKVFHILTTWNFYKTEISTQVLLHIFKFFFLFTDFIFLFRFFFTIFYKLDIAGYNLSLLWPIFIRVEIFSNDQRKWKVVVWLMEGKLSRREDKRVREKFVTPKITYCCIEHRHGLVLIYYVAVENIQTKF